VVDDPVADLPAEIETLAVTLQVIHDPEALLAVAERPAEEGRQGLLAEVPERRVPEVVPQGDRLGEVLVQAQGPGDGPGHLGDLQGVGEADAVVVPLGGDEHLGLVLQPAERLGMDDPVPVSLEGGSQIVRWLLALPALGFTAEGGPVGQRAPFDLLQLLPNRAHRA
jgi:hypothetical protein